MKLRDPLDFLDIFKTSTRERYDWISPLAILGLGTVGLFFIYSAQLATGRGQWIQQIVWLGAGAVLYCAVALIDYKFWLKYAHWAYVACLVPLFLLWTPLGVTRLGATRWIDFGPFSLQPSELAKLGTLIMSASLLARSEIGTVRDSLAVLGKLALAAGLPILFILLQPDLGSALVIPPMAFALLYVSNLSQRFFLAALGAFALLMGVVALDTYRYLHFLEVNNLSPSTDKGAYEPHGLLPLHDYQRNRLLAFIAPERIDPMGISWNLRQSLISVGSGGFGGKGWTEGTQAKLGYLPRAVAHNDFIFSVIAEEKGFLGSISVLGLFGVVLWNGIRIAGLARDRFGTLLAIGVTVLFAVHVFVNIAMTIGLVPITGIPLPFISYGGSFALNCCVLQGLVQSVYRFRKEF
ncbi:MAG: rod shape-determining protein RodA [Opitutaceae bacterium]|nr:rod shape-determining protein RodA [Opitutaceae bacterium]